MATLPFYIEKASSSVHAWHIFKVGHGRVCTCYDIHFANVMASLLNHASKGDVAAVVADAEEAAVPAASLGMCHRRHRRLLRVKPPAKASAAESAADRSSDSLLSLSHVHLPATISDE